MDPVSVVAGISTVLAVIAKSVSTLNSLRIQYSDAELKLELLAGQLQTVEAALRQVRALVADCLSLESQHQQLIADLNLALSYCRLLVQHIDNHISKLWAPGGGLKAGSRILHALEDKAIEEYLTRLDHQLSALNLCLTAFKWFAPSIDALVQFADSPSRTPVEQKRLLDQVESRTILEQAEDDASSLVAVDHSPSTLVSRRASVMSTQSKLSKVFTFDELLLRHKVYQKSFRYMLRRASAPLTTESHCRSPSPSSMSALELRDLTERSARLDSMLKEDARKRKRELKILALGHKRSTIVKQLRSKLGPLFQDEDLQFYRRTIVKALVTSLLRVIEHVETRGTGLVTKKSTQYATLLRQFAKSASPDWEVSADVSAAARALWRNWFVQQSFRQMNQDCLTAFFLKSTDRIMDSGYQPSLTDIIRAPENVSTVRETRLSVNNLSVDLIEIPQRKIGRILHQFDKVDACLLNLDLTSYDRYIDENDGYNTLAQSLRYFETVCRSGWVATKPVLLVCVNYAAFREKLQKSPLSIHFPDYTGGSDANAAVHYILHRCKQVVGKEQDLFHHVAYDDAEDPSTIQFFGDQAASLPTIAWIQSASSIRLSNRFSVGYPTRLLSSHSA